MDTDSVSDSSFSIEDVGRYYPDAGVESYDDVMKDVYPDASVESYDSMKDVEIPNFLGDVYVEREGHATTHRLRFNEPENNRPDTMVKSYVYWQLFLLPEVEEAFESLVASLKLMAGRYYNPVNEKMPVDHECLAWLEEKLKEIGDDNADQRETVVCILSNGTPRVRYRDTEPGTTLEFYIRRLRRLDKWGTNAHDLFVKMLERCDTLLTMLADYYVAVDHLMRKNPDKLSEADRRLLDGDYA